MDRESSSSTTHPTLGLIDTLAHGDSVEVSAQREGAPIVGASLGRFRVVRRLGAGGMGEVYAGVDERLDREVAIKLLRARSSTANAARLEREAKAMAKLSHPNVISVYEIGDVDGQPFIVMELIRGRTLEQWLEQPHTRAQLLSTFVSAGRGLAAAHAAGLVHRDFKPSNVMIADDGRVLVMDFGLAHGLTRSLEQTEGSAPSPEEIGAAFGELTATGAVLGTPAYMAPEQFRGATTDARCDQFAFCVALWEAVYGQRPFYASNVAALAAAVCHGRIERPPRRAPRWLLGALERGLSVDPGARWPTMTPLLELLERRSRAWMTRGPLLALAVVAVLALLYLGRQQIPPSTDPAAAASSPPPAAGSFAAQTSEASEQSSSRSTASDPAAAKPEHDSSAVEPNDPSQAAASEHDSSTDGPHDPSQTAAPEHDSSTVGPHDPSQTSQLAPNDETSTAGPPSDLPNDAPPATTQSVQCALVASTLPGSRLQPRGEQPKRCRALAGELTSLGVSERALLLRARGRALELVPGRTRKFDGACWRARGHLDDDYLSVSVTLDAASCKR